MSQQRVRGHSEDCAPGLRALELPWTKTPRPGSRRIRYDDRVEAYDEAAALGREAELRFGAFIREQVNPGAIERDASGTSLSRALLERSAELGLLNYSLPRELGGGGADAFAWGVALEQVGYLCVDGSFPLVLSLHAAVAHAILRGASPMMLERYVVPMIQGRRLGCFAYTEGADAFSFRSTAVRRGDRWILDGDKQLVTGGAHGDVFMTYVRRTDHDDLAVFLVERDDPGVSVEPVEVAGLRAAGLSALRLRAVEVPDERMLVPTDGISHAQLFLNDRRGLLVCGPLGRMRGIVEEVARTVQQTVRYGQPVSSLPNVQATLGRMFVAVEAAQAMVHRALWGMRRPDRNPIFDASMAAAKHFVIEQAIAVATAALRLTGSAGFLRGNHYERYLRDFHGGIAGGGAQDILEVNLGAHLTSEVARRRDGET